MNNIKLNGGDIVLDIGANFGSFTAVASRKVGNKGRVISFEPGPAVYSRLLKTIESNNFENIIPFNEAVSGEDGHMSFYVHAKSAYSTMMELVGGRMNADTKTIIVKSRTINDIISEIGDTINLLKLDCEGAEYSILDSFDSKISAKILQIVMETHEVPNRNSGEIPIMLRNFGFKVINTNPLTAFRDAGQ